VGQSCDWPFNLWTGSHLIAQLGNGAADYVSGVRQTILAGGDSGSRGVYVGAAQAARMGAAADLPTNWTAKVTAWPSIAPLAAQLVAHRAASVSAGDA
jgi:ADP-ribosylglycohydrolase